MPAAVMIVVIVLGLAAVFAVAVVLPKLVYRFMERPLEARIAAHYGSEEVLMKDLKANSFGLESAGVRQARGNGGLVLTAKSLHFFMFLPGWDLRVPPGAISEVWFSRSRSRHSTRGWPPRRRSSAATRPRSN
jgi:hypothetical protein